MSIFLDVKYKLEIILDPRDLSNWMRISNQMFVIHFRRFDRFDILDEEVSSKAYEDRVEVRIPHIVKAERLTEEQKWNHDYLKMTQVYLLHKIERIILSEIETQLIINNLQDEYKKWKINWVRVKDEKEN